MTPLQGAGLLFFISFLPPLILAVWLRNAERSGREPWVQVSRAFLWGAVIAVTISVFAEEYLAAGLSVAVVSIVIAPVVEELAKALGLFVIRDSRHELENGIVYGGAIGLGFAATENLVYVASAYFTQGPEVAAWTAAFRGLATVSLHASTTAFVGYAVWRLRFRPRRFVGFLLAPLAFMLAVFTHAFYNTLATFQQAALALGLGVALFLWTLRRVRRAERR